MKIGGRRRQLALRRDPAGRFDDLFARRAPNARGDCSAIGVAWTAVLVRVKTEIGEPRQKSGGQGARLQLLHLPQEQDRTGEQMSAKDGASVGVALQPGFIAVEKCRLNHRDGVDSLTGGIEKVQKPT